MKKDIYIIASRHGCELLDTVIKYTENEANEYINSKILEDIQYELNYELEKFAEGRTLTEEEILEWAKENEYCDENAFTYGSDWHEFLWQKETIEIEEPEYLARKVWTKKDIQDALKEKGYEPSDTNIEALKDVGLFKYLSNPTEDDWDAITSAIYNSEIEK